MQKLPLQLSQLVDIAKTVNGGFEEVRNYFMMLFMTLGMMRESEAANLDFANVSVQMLGGEEYLSLLVVMSKTDQMSLGHTVLILLAKGNSMCMVVPSCMVQDFLWMPFNGRTFSFSFGTK